MPRLNPIKWQEFEKFLLFIGCEFKREKGDHRVYWRYDLKRPIIIPRYNPLPIMIIKSNLRTLHLSNEEYFEILKKI